MQPKKIIFLASDCESSRWVYHALEADFNIEAVILEQPISKKKLIKGRLKKIGLLPIIGQILFTLLIVPVLKLKAKKRKAALINQYNLSDKNFDDSKTIRVKTVNSEGCIKAINKLMPDIIIVNGTRIISKKILQSSNAVFINMHVGITPYYRGSHGGYWAIRNDDSTNFGTTIHIIDTGIDTGPVLKQVFIKPTIKDNFTTYPILQVAIGIAGLKEVLKEYQVGKIQGQAHTIAGKMYYQPTIWQYLTGKKKTGHQSSSTFL